MSSDPHRLDRLIGCHPILIAALPRLCRALAELGHTLVITSSIRTDAEQAALYAQGRTVPGQLVTHLDGTVKRSRHQIQPDGYGHAVDVAWRADDGRIVWDGPWPLFGVMAESLGLVWGGRWTRFPDRPHLEVRPAAKTP